MLACLPGAIYRDLASDTVLIDSDKCINCASCAMACPYGVIRYHEDYTALPGKVVAVKCDNCRKRQQEGLIPACVEICKTNALSFEEVSEAMKKKTDAVSRSISIGAEKCEPPPGFGLLNAIKKTMVEIRNT
jgi:carbon-monoxide dehydrogenase iron sulfur subunit